MSANQGTSEAAAFSSSTAQNKLHPLQSSPHTAKAPDFAMTILVNVVLRNNGLDQQNDNFLFVGNQEVNLSHAPRLPQAVQLS